MGFLDPRLDTTEDAATQTHSQVGVLTYPPKLNACRGFIGTGIGLRHARMQAKDPVQRDGDHPWPTRLVSSVERKFLTRSAGHDASALTNAT